jgi:hypothetical protein
MNMAFDLDQTHVNILDKQNATSRDDLDVIALEVTFRHQGPTEADRNNVETISTMLKLR